ncbi:nucleotidyltransferase family protein, partial [Heyndrickxia sporothermodurans]
MNSTGLIVEYNPFHNGHFFHVEEARKRTDADVIIAVMSGNFLQRGEPAIISKWARAKMALQAGVDIVVELPYAFAVQHAETFAYGSINILHALKCNSFCFGSESG